MAHMKPFSLFTIVFALLAAVLVAAAPVVVVVRDVWDPTILTPNTGTVWQVNKAYNVTWDTSSAPAQVTNSNGKVVLAKGGLLDYENPLASGFSLYDGSVQVTVPSGTVPGSDYTIILFGDSGNSSNNFTISA